MLWVCFVVKASNIGLFGRRLCSPGAFLVQDFSCVLLDIQHFFLLSVDLFYRFLPDRLQFVYCSQTSTLPSLSSLGSFILLVFPYKLGILPLLFYLFFSIHMHFLVEEPYHSSHSNYGLLIVVIIFFIIFLFMKRKASHIFLIIQYVSTVPCVCASLAMGWLVKLLSELSFQFLLILY